MKSFLFPISNFVVLGVLLCAAHPCSSQAAQSGTPQPAAAKTEEKDILPKSLFVMPRNPNEGKDPFFPLSIRVYNIPPPVVAPATNTTPVLVSYELKVNGVSGTAENRLAIINNKTFAVGDEAEVPTAAGRVRIKLLEIKGDVIWVQVGSERRALQMKPY